MTELNKTFTVENLAQREWAAEQIKNLPDARYIVSISTEGKKRSIEQNKLYWKWIGELSIALYDNREDIHEAMKEKFLLPIMRRDFEDVEISVRAVKELNRNNHPQAGFWRKKVINHLISTTRLSVKQFTEYLDEVHKWASSMQIALTDPNEE